MGISTRAQLETSEPPNLLQALCWVPRSFTRTAACRPAVGRPQPQLPCSRGSKPLFYAPWGRPCNTGCLAIGSCRSEAGGLPREVATAYCGFPSRIAGLSAGPWILPTKPTKTQTGCCHWLKFYFPLLVLKGIYHSAYLPGEANGRSWFPIGLLYLALMPPPCSSEGHGSKRHLFGEIQVWSQGVPRSLGPSEDPDLLSPQSTEFRKALPFPLVSGVVFVIVEETKTPPAG